jgi:GAF domain-containing protein
MTSRERDIVRTFIKLSDRLVEDFDVVDVTTQLTEDCAKLLDVAAAGLLLADAGGVLHLLAGTSHPVRTLEIFQLQREEGPCLDCFRSGSPVSVPDLHAERARWPRFSAVAAELGFASVHAIPMRLRDQVLGALGLFGSNPGELDDDDLAFAQALAHVASIAIVHQNHSLSAGNVLAGLRAAVASRRLLEVAKGVVSELQGISMDEAFLRLRQYARLHDQRLSEVAYRVVTETGDRRAVLLTELAVTAEPV